MFCVYVNLQMEERVKELNQRLQAKMQQQRNSDDSTSPPIPPSSSSPPPLTTTATISTVAPKSAMKSEYREKSEPQVSGYWHTATVCLVFLSLSNATVICLVQWV